jgi:hypothetical protein
VFVTTLLLVSKLVTFAIKINVILHGIVAISACSYIFNQLL